MSDPFESPKPKQLKVWRREEAARIGLSESAVAMRMSRGRYRHLKLIREHARLIWVIES
jgi:hypothetical protein